MGSVTVHGLTFEKDTIYVDHHQRDVAAEVKGDPHFAVKALQWRVGGSKYSCDYAWWAPGTGLVMVEEKKAGDLATSMSSRRLQRELRGIKAAADIAVLGLRCENLEWSHEAWEAFEIDRFRLPALFQCTEIAKWTNHGRIILVPAEGVPEFLVKMVAVIGRGTPATRTILAGGDTKRPTGPTPFQTRLIRLFDGMGPVAAAKIEKAADGIPLAHLLDDFDEDWWRAAGANKGILRQLEEMV